MDNKYNYIIGDIHGCFEELLELEKIIKEDSDKANVLPFIISCGDLIDRGPYSKEVLEHFIKGEKNKTHIAIIGNHELMMLQCLENVSSKEQPVTLPKFHETYNEMFELSKIYFPETSLEMYVETMNKIWLQAGGRETFHSFGIGEFYLSRSKITKEIIDYLINLPLFYEGDNFFVTHAIANNNDLEKIKSFNNKMNNQELIGFRKVVNNVIWNKKVPPKKINEKLNISGHSPFKTVKILSDQNALQIDTGCVYGNKLTAYCVETNSFLFVEAKKQYREKKLKE
jgi:hypothetical protein